MGDEDGAGMPTSVTGHRGDPAGPSPAASDQVGTRSTDFARVDMETEGRAARQAVGSQEDGGTRATLGTAGPPSDELASVAFEKRAERSAPGGRCGGERPQAGPVPSDPDEEDLGWTAEACELTSTCGTLRSEEHVYCTVYCIANDTHRSSVNPGGRARLQGAAVTPASTSDEGPERYPEPLSLTALMEPRSAGDSYGAEPGASVLLTCRVCLDDKRIKPLHCCKKAVCDECLRLYINSQVHLGKADLVCPITECSGYLEESTVLGHLAGEDMAKYKYFLELSKIDSSTKPCPQCSLFTSLKSRGLQTASRAEHKYKVQCSKCRFVWCFKCHAPWHEGLRCREYRKGDKLLRHWASVIEHGQRNAQKCPRCKIHIQRTEGCDHMTCTQCNTNFCYRCGEKYRHLRFFGDHTSNLSIFGCKYRYLPEKPHLRRLVRGSVCVSKVLIAPLVIVLVGVFGAMAVVIGLIAFPIYYICKKRRKRSQGSGHWFC